MIFKNLIKYNEIEDGEVFKLCLKTTISSVMHTYYRYRNEVSQYFVRRLFDNLEIFGTTGNTSKAIYQLNRKIK